MMALCLASGVSWLYTTEENNLVGTIPTELGKSALLK
jgi:hypothetical protein